MRGQSTKTILSLFRSRTLRNQQILQRLLGALARLSIQQAYVDVHLCVPAIANPRLNQPLNYEAKDNEKELILPAIHGVRAILEAAASHPDVTRVVITSSFASVLDANRKAPHYFTYTGEDWNPMTYEESIDKAAPAFIAYRGSKKFAELEAWNFVKESKPAFDIVTLCPPMTFGPIVHPVKDVNELNESNSKLWSIASGAKPLPVSRVPFWIDVRDLAKAHVEALLRPEVGGKRYVPACPERFSFGQAAKIMVDEFESLKDTVSVEDQAVDASHGLDGETAAKELGFKYHPFKQTVVDLISQTLKMAKDSSS